MSGSAKKRREKARQRARRAHSAGRQADWPRALTEQLLNERERLGAYLSTKTDAALDDAIRDVEFSAFTDPTRHMYAGG